MIELLAVFLVLLILLTDSWPDDPDGMA